VEFGLLASAAVARLSVAMTAHGCESSAAAYGRKMHIESEYGTEWDKEYLMKMADVPTP
jgi:hypothetical protein